MPKSPNGSESLVGDSLRNIGYEVEYERPIPNIDKALTPDWYVFATKETPGFYVEVFEPSPRKDWIKEDKSWAELSKRITKLGLPYALQISAGQSCLPPDSGKGKKIAHITERWLKENSPNPGDSIILHHHTLDVLHEHFETYWNGITIEVYEKIAEGSPGWCFAPMIVRKISTDSLKDNIESKIRKYGPALAEQEIPFVICLVPQFRSMLDRECLEDVLWGKRITVAYPRENGGWLLENSRERNGILMGSDPISEQVSAIVWMSEEKLWIDDAREPIVRPITAYHNPRALNLLPKHALDFRQK